MNSRHIKRYKRTSTGIIVEAGKLTEDSLGDLATWSQGRIVEEKNPFDEEDTADAINIKTPAGYRRLSPGNWLVYHLEAFFVITDMIFSRLYEEVDAPSIHDPLPNDPFHKVPRVGDLP